MRLYLVVFASFLWQVLESLKPTCELWVVEILGPLNSGAIRSDHGVCMLDYPST